MRLRTAWVLVLSFLVSQGALAGGLWITEFGQPTQGRAGAGEEAGNGDATDAFLNPAAMSRLEKSEILVSVGVVAPSVEFDVESQDDGIASEFFDPFHYGRGFFDCDTTDDATRHAV